jgi:hypothetical protein
MQSISGNCSLGLRAFGLHAFMQLIIGRNLRSTRERLSTWLEVRFVGGVRFVPKSCEQRKAGELYSRYF